MKAFLYIEDDKVGEVDFKVIDESMGAIAGNLLAYPGYGKYRSHIQNLFDQKGIANIEDFDFGIILEDNSKLNPAGGIGVTDSREFEEIYVEAAGLGSEFINKFVLST